MLFLVTTFGLVCIVWRQTEPASTWRITLSQTSVFVTFSLLWQNMWQSQLKEGRVYSGSQAAGSVHPCREDIASGEGSHWAHWSCCQEAEGNEHLLLSFAFPFYAVLAPAYSVTLIQGSSPYLSWLYRNPFTEMLRHLFPRCFYILSSGQYLTIAYCFFSSTLYQLSLHGHVSFLPSLAEHLIIELPPGTHYPKIHMTFT